MHALAAAAPQRAAPRAVPPTGPPRTASRVARHRPSPPPQALWVRAALRAGPALRLRAAPRPCAAFRVLCVGPTNPERRPYVVLHLGTFGERGRAVARTYIARFNLGEAVRSARRSRPPFPPAVPARSSRPPSLALLPRIQAGGQLSAGTLQLVSAWFGGRLLLPRRRLRRHALEAMKACKLAVRCPSRQ